MRILLLIILALFALYPKLDNRQTYEAYLGLSFLIIIVAQELWKKIHPSVSLAFGLMALSALKCFFFPPMFSFPISQELLAGAGGEYLYSLVGLLLFAALLLFWDFKDFLKILFAIAVLDSVMICVTTLLWGHNYALLGNKSADASFIACMLPMAFDWRKND